MIPESTTNPDLLDEHFDVQAPPARGPDFRELPEQKRTTSSGDKLLYVTVPMPRAVRLGAVGHQRDHRGVAGATPRAVFRDVAPRLLFAGSIGLARRADRRASMLWASLYRPWGG